MDKKVSVIIPAYNEEGFIGKTLESYKSQDYPLEIIVVVNNSTDKTFEIAHKYADKVLNFPEKIGVSRARNEGARVSEGKVLLFSDADSWIETGGIKKIAEKTENNTVGAILGMPDKKELKGQIFFSFKNLVHRLKIYEGVIDGVLFCHRDVFLKSGGFDSKKEPDELRDFIKKSKTAGAKYRLVQDSYAFTSLRRYKNGYVKNFIFWVKWKFFYFFGKKKKMADEAEKYYKSIKY